MAIYVGDKLMQYPNIKIVPLRPVIDTWSNASLLNWSEIQNLQWGFVLDNEKLIHTWSDALPSTWGELEKLTWELKAKSEIPIAKIYKGSELIFDSSKN